ncbi:MAG: SDR family NAD(P)-dependent oxidoreductase, partial [Thiomargarita sp.]|nr:SDR family NAD(P)-dependent oxidoreductase [Thiomargarita sp.]
MNLNLSGEIALVTGASRGIGQGVAVALGKAGAEIIGTATTSVGAKGITQNFKKQGICGEGVVLNIADSDATQAVLERLGTKKPSILVNNAGITQDNLLVRMKDDEWDKVINT